MKSIQEDIKNGTYKQAYLLHGEEPYLISQYKRNLIRAMVPEEDDMNYSHYEGKGINVRGLIDQCETMPFFADRRVILIENSGFFKNKCDELADYMKSIPEYLHLVFVEEEVDKRSRMYKAVKECGSIVPFMRQDDKTLMVWAARILKQEGKNIRQRDMELFLAKTGDDMGNIRMELEKLITYCMTQNKDTITAQDIEAICTTQIENKIFEMVRCVTEKKQEKALELYYDLLTLKEPPMRILFLLARSFRQLLEVKYMQIEGRSQNDMMSALGIPGFALRNLLSITNVYASEELKEAVQDCVEAEEAVKSGRLDEVLSVELLIIKYSGGRK